MWLFFYDITLLFLLLSLHEVCIFIYCNISNASKFCEQVLACICHSRPASHLKYQSRLQLFTSTWHTVFSIALWLHYNAWVHQQDSCHCCWAKFIRDQKLPMTWLYSWSSQVSVSVHLVKVIVLLSFKFPQCLFVNESAYFM